MLEVNNLKSWKEVTKGIFKFQVLTNKWYEIHIAQWNRDLVKLGESDAKLFICGEYLGSQGRFFNRKFMIKGNLDECLITAYSDNKNYIKK